MCAAPVSPIDKLQKRKLLRPMDAARVVYKQASASVVAGPPRKAAVQSVLKFTPSSKSNQAIDSPMDTTKTTYPLPQLLSRDWCGLVDRCTGPLLLLLYSL